MPRPVLKLHVPAQQSAKLCTVQDCPKTLNLAPPGQGWLVLPRISKIAESRLRSDPNKKSAANQMKRQQIPEIQELS